MPLVDEPDTALEEKAWANQATIRLYDPPRDGKTPADGAGVPLTSACYLKDKEGQIALGFTTTPVGWEGAWQTLGDFPVRPEATFAPIEEQIPEKPKGTVMRSTSRTRTIKR